MNRVITIDGPAGSGKSTVSRLLAKRIHFLYLDTGAMYRAVALEARRRGLDLEDGNSLGDLCRTLSLHYKTDEDPPRLVLGNEDITAAIRSPEMDMVSSKVSTVKAVRDAMTDLQRKMAKELKKVVAEGRDMGTVVFPDAEFKFFITADPKVRAERRYRERVARGEHVTRTAVLEDLQKRDHQDQTRSLAPLNPAKDAKIVDSTALTVEEVIEEILIHLKRK
jgi:cytidylate kinase